MAIGRGGWAEEGGRRGQGGREEEGGTPREGLGRHEPWWQQRTCASKRRVHHSGSIHQQWLPATLSWSVALVKEVPSPKMSSG